MAFLFGSQPCRSTHSCLRVERLLSGVKGSLKGTGAHREPSNLLQRPKVRRQAHVGCSVRGGGGAGREAERGNLPQVPQFPLEVLCGRGQRPSSARNLLCDHPPAPCPLWASSPCKMKRGGLEISQTGSSCNKMGESSPGDGSPLPNGHTGGHLPMPRLRPGLLWASVSLWCQVPLSSFPQSEAKNRKALFLII